MKRRVALVAICLITVGGLGAVPALEAASKRERVRAVNFEFKPARVKIRKGGKVVWVFKEGTHNVVGKGFKSKTKKRGTYEHRFKKPGKYEYRCTLHQPQMDGVVKVVR